MKVTTSETWLGLIIVIILAYIVYSKKSNPVADNAPLTPFENNLNYYEDQYRQLQDLTNSSDPDL